MMHAGSACHHAGSRERNGNNHDKYEQKYCSSSTHRTLYAGIVLGAMGNKTDQSSICCWIPKRASRSNNSRVLDNIGEDYSIMLLPTYPASKTPQETMEFLCDSCSISSIEKA